MLTKVPIGVFSATDPLYMACVKLGCWSFVETTSMKEYEYSLAASKPSLLKVNTCKAAVLRPGVGSGCAL